MMVVKLDLSKSVWVRIRDHLVPTVGARKAGMLATVLLPYVLAERIAAKQEGRGS